MSLELAFDEIREKLTAITVAEDLIYALERARGISADEARTRLREFKQKRLQLEADRAALALTSSGSSGLSEAEIKSFAAKVRRLSNQNAQAGALKAAILEITTMVGIVSQA